MTKEKKKKVKVHPKPFLLAASRNREKLLCFPDARRTGKERPPMVGGGPGAGSHTEVMTIMRCGEMLEILFKRSGASCDKWLSENSQGGKIWST